jgi:hypothetical protein
MTQLDWFNIQRCAQERFNAYFLDSGDRFIGESRTTILAYELAWAVYFREATP